MKINWFFIIFSVVIPLGTVLGMGFTLLVDHIKMKRRKKRTHRHISEWWELTVE